MATKHSKSVSHSDSRFYPNVQSAMKYYTHRYCWRLGMPLMQYYYFVKYWIVENLTKSKWHQMAGYFLRIFDIVNWKHKRWPVGESNMEYMGPATEEQVTIIRSLSS
ncbi:MAG: hypothetical protein SPJ13_06775 [Bacteroidales bacterium]|nr:hypothetical protein [Bacteroidales bacterium]